MALERVQKILAQAGIASRRKAEELIQEGHVTVNGKAIKLGDKAEWGKDAIKVNGKLLHQMDAPVYLAFHKPRNVISMLADPEGRQTLADFLSKVQHRVFPIGRLDFTSEGLILLTNDGAFAEKMQKDDQALRVYSIKVKGHPDAEMMSRLKRGLRVGGHRKRAVTPHSIRLAEELASKAQIEVVIRGGGAVDIKAFFEQRGFLVERIVRTAIGHISVKGLKPGTFRFLKASQAYALLNQPELGERRWDHETHGGRGVTPKKRTPHDELPIPLATPRAPNRPDGERKKSRVIKPRGATRRTPSPR